jgi:hypothetical protein
MLILYVRTYIILGCMRAHMLDWALARPGPGHTGPWPERVLAHWALTRLDPGQTGPWPDWALSRPGSGQTGPWPDWALARLGPGQTGPWPDWALARVGPGQTGPWPDWALARPGLKRGAKYLRKFNFCLHRLIHPAAISSCQHVHEPVGRITRAQRALQGLIK